MKTQARFVAAIVMTLLCYVSSAQASSLGDLLGFKPGPSRTYTNSVANSDQSQYPGTVQYRAQAYQVSPVQRTQSMDARQSAAPGLANQQPGPQTQTSPQQVTSSRPASKEKAGHRAAAKTRLPSVTTLPANQQSNGRVAYTYQPIYPSQAPNASLQAYRQPPAPVYYSNPYPSQYTPARNYYQGYSYNTWGSGSSAQACPPGRA